MRVYATVADYLNYTGTPANWRTASRQPGRAAQTVDYVTYTGQPDDFMIPQRVLARASHVIDRALTAAIYEVDVDGMPTDDTVLAALRDATCAQARQLVEHPEEPFGPLTAEAYDVLYAAGLVPTHPRMVG